VRVVEKEAPTLRRNHASPLRRRTGHGQLPDTVSDAFFSRTQPSLWTRKRHVCGAAKRWNVAAVVELSPWMPLQNCHSLRCRQNKFTGKRR